VRQIHISPAAWNTAVMGSWWGCSTMAASLAAPTQAPLGCGPAPNLQPPTSSCPCTLACCTGFACLLQHTSPTPPHPYQWSSREHRQVAVAAGVPAVAGPVCCEQGVQLPPQHDTPALTSTHARAARSTLVPAACMKHTPGSPGACCIDSHTSWQRLSSAPVKTHT
jgi:hypothetical protein